MKFLRRLGFGRPRQPYPAELRERVLSLFAQDGGRQWWRNSLWLEVRGPLKRLDEVLDDLVRAGLILKPKSIGYRLSNLGRRKLSVSASTATPEGDAVDFPRVRTFEDAVEVVTMRMGVHAGSTIKFRKPPTGSDPVGESGYAVTYLPLVMIPEGSFPLPDISDEAEDWTAWPRLFAVCWTQGKVIGGLEVRNVLAWGIEFFNGGIEPLGCLILRMNGKPVGFFESVDDVLHYLMPGFDERHGFHILRHMSEDDMCSMLYMHTFRSNKGGL
ncbi:hypothetical protein AB0A63_13930 [Lentzea sp. NPDC042327]|uniref:hypothetical protein n=1 Tax=Lentzea sp. NPDC042327 TaxID=3154801 RepID=UPI0033C26757